MLPQATQSLTKTGITRRTATCPLHKKQSSEYMGVSFSESGADVWKFRCTALTQKGVKADHIFVARADPHAPRTPMEAIRWVNEQKQKQAGLKVLQ